ncbi:MAG: helix-turn-helix transcriptional regulator [Myxococcota bacterium]
MSCVTRIGELVGDRIRERRKGLDITQAELARRIGIPRPIVSRIECGKHTPRLETLDAVADALSTTIMDLVAPVDGMRLGAEGLHVPLDEIDWGEEE